MRQKHETDGKQDDKQREGDSVRGLEKIMG